MIKKAATVQISASAAIVCPFKRVSMCRLKKLMGLPAGLKRCGPCQAQSVGFAT